MFIEQWCLPFRRQHAASPASASEARSGLITERLMRASNTDARYH